MIDVTRPMVTSVVKAWRIDPRARIVDRRSLVIRRRGAVIDGCRRVDGRRGCVVPVVVIRLRTRGDACSGNCTDRATYDGTVTAVNVMANRGADACANERAEQCVVMRIRLA